MFLVSSSLGAGKGAQKAPVRRLCSAGGGSSSGVRAEFCVGSAAFLAAQSFWMSVSYGVVIAHTWEGTVEMKEVKMERLAQNPAPGCGGQMSALTSSSA